LLYVASEAEQTSILINRHARLSENAIVSARPIRGFVDPTTTQPVVAQMIRPFRIDE
jgi:hypothetical protein